MKTWEEQSSFKNSKTQVIGGIIMLKQRHEFIGALHIEGVQIKREDQDNLTQKIVINCNHISEGPYQGLQFIDMILIYDEAECFRIGRIIKPLSLDVNISDMIYTFSTELKSFSDHPFDFDVIKSILMIMATNENWSTSPIVDELINKVYRKYQLNKIKEYVYLTVTKFVPEEDEEGWINIPYKTKFYNNRIEKDYPLDEEEMDEDQFYDDDDDIEEEVVEEVIIEEDEEEYHPEYSQIFSKHFFNEKNVDFSRFTFGYVIHEDDTYTKLHASLPQDQDQALQMVKNTVANIELRFKPVADQWNTNPKLLELYEEIKKYNLEEVEGDETWFHDKGSTIVNSKELRELMKKVLTEIGLEQNPDTDYWKLKKEEN